MENVGFEWAIIELICSSNKIKVILLRSSIERIPLKLRMSRRFTLQLFTEHI